MNYKLLKLLLAFLGLAAILYSCMDDDLTDINSTLEYEAEFSLPVGVDTLLLEQLVQSVILIPVPDYVDKDTVRYFFYDSTFYYSPGTLSDSISAPLILTPFKNDTAEIVSLMFRLNAANLIPAEFRIQIYFADSNNVILDSLYNDGPFILDPALTDESGIVTGLWEVLKDNTLPPEKIDKLMDMTHVILDTKMIIPDSSLDTVPIPFYHDQSLWIQVGVRVGLKLTINVF
jgi:hypothetical protein